jgi:ATP-dependent Clp protease ATP-binding subunit ClpA
MARRGELDPVVGREEEIAQVIQTLSRRKKNNPALIGEAGVGKTELARALAAFLLDDESRIVRLALRRIEVMVSDQVLDKLSADGFDPVYGARPLRREVERQLENPLAMRIVTGECPEGSKVYPELREGQIQFRIDRPSGARSTRPAAY